MKNVILLLALMMNATVMSAQIGKKSKSALGVKITIGKNMAAKETTFVGQPFDFIRHEVSYTGSNAVVNVGGFFQKKFGWLYLRSELGYTQYTQNYDIKSHVQVTNPVEFAKEKFHYIDWEVMAGLTKNNFRFGAGPVAHILVNNSTELDFISGFDARHRTLTYGFLGGIGYDTGKLSLDVKYEVGFRNVGDHLYYGNRSARSLSKAHMLNFTVAYAL